MFLELLLMSRRGAIVYIYIYKGWHVQTFWCDSTSREKEGEMRERACAHRAEMRVRWWWRWWWETRSGEKRTNYNPTGVDVLFFFFSSFLLLLALVFLFNSRDFIGPWKRGGRWRDRLRPEPTGDWNLVVWRRWISTSVLRSLPLRSTACQNHLLSKEREIKYR